MLRIDASQLECFGDCHERFRRRYIENIVPKKPAIHLEFGKAFHFGPEMFWKGKGYDEAFTRAIQHVASVDQSELGPQERDKWQEMQRYLPDMLACYFESHSPDEIDQYNPNEIEFEWVYRCQGFELCGKIDRLSKSRILYDIKTASAVGKDWKENLRQQYLRKIGIGLYDWYLCKNPITLPSNVIIEVCVKPYRGSKPQVVEIELPEIIAYRQRFQQQLEWRVAELKHYIENYAGTKPWPMNDGAVCVTKYGQCDYLKRLCNVGDSPRNLAHFKPREEHLEVMK